MQEAIAETLGLMVYFIVSKVGTMANDDMGSDENSEGRLAEAR